MRKFITTLFLILSIQCFSQTQFSIGFDVGFKKGYCFDGPINCLPPLTPLVPMTKINENYNSWQDGYNRGFLVGNELSVYNSHMNGGVMPITPRYVAPINPVPSAFSSGRYIPPVDLNLLRIVLEYKQKLFDTRGAWLQRRIDELSFLNDILLLEIDTEFHGVITTAINYAVNELNKGGDLTDNNYFFDWAGALVEIETSILETYHEYKKK